MEIQGLTPLQMEIADHLWALETKEEVKAWIMGLPTQHLRAMAIGLYHLMLIESIDEALDFSDLSLANHVIDSIK